VEIIGMEDVSIAKYLSAGVPLIGGPVCIRVLAAARAEDAAAQAVAFRTAITQVAGELILRSSILPGAALGE